MRSSARFEELKALIFEAAEEASEIGDVAETVKWGQPSFAPAKANIGSSVRIEERADGMFALMFICTTGLVDHFREIYPDALVFEGKRGILVSKGRIAARDALKHCIQLAFTHKLRRKRSAGKA